MQRNTADEILVERVRSGDLRAWQDFVNRFEGRLSAFVRSRLSLSSQWEDVVQETFVGFMISLPHYNPETPVESFLFSIAAHKLTDLLRREGRRPALALDDNDPEGRERTASTLLRSHERREDRSDLIAITLSNLIRHWRQKGEWERLKCAELLFVCGEGNKEVATILGISEQAVANHKFAILAKLKESARLAGLQEEIA